MSRLDDIKARAERVHWTSTSIEQAMARMASSAADVPWLLALVESLTAERDDMAWQRTQALNERDALAAQVARVEPTLSLLHHRGLVDSKNNRDDVADALEIVRAALSGFEADTGAEEAGHRCEPYYSRAECGQCGWQEQWCVTCSRQMCGCATDAMGADQ